MSKNWSTTELAAAAGVDPSRIRQLLLEGRIRAQKVGPVWVIPDQEAKRWLRSRGVKVERD
jgi:hypothetical protein